MKGTEYLEQALNSNALVSEPSPVLDKIYALNPPPTLTREEVTLGTSAEELLLGKDQLLEIAKEFNDDEISVLGKRAIIQLTKQMDGEILKREAKERQHEAVSVASEKENVAKVKESEDQGKGL